MGTCTLRLDQIQILNKRSDSGHSDNDWLSVTWFVGPNQVKTDSVPLYNKNGSVILDTGDTLQPVELSVGCSDTDLVSAAIVAVNLGSLDFSQQANAAAEIGKKVSQKIAAIYLDVVELYAANAGLPLGQVWATAVDKLAPMIVDSIGVAWDDVILPVVGDVVRALQALLGRPDCNGEIFHDLVVFEPWTAGAAQSWSRTYSAHSPDSCGMDPHTAVAYTRERTADSSGQFPNTPAPKVDTTEAQDAPIEAWYGVWADNPTSSAPHIQVSLGQVPIGFGIQPSVMTLKIRESIGPDSEAAFEAAADFVSPKTAMLPPFQGNVFGTRKPHVDVSAQPVGESVHVPAASDSRDPIATVTLQDRALVSFGPHASDVLGASVTDTGAIGDIGNALKGTVSADAIALTDSGVYLSLYTASVRNNPIGYFLRYTRADTAQYTYTDVMLARWMPV